TGANWMLNSLEAMGEDRSVDERMRNLTDAVIKNQQRETPISKWPLAELTGKVDWRDSYRTIGQFMTTDLFTVRADDLVDFAATLMEWKHIRHVPVEDADHNLVGLVTHRTLMRVLSKRASGPPRPITVSEVMQRDLVTIEPGASTLEAIDLMRRHRIACLPVVEDGRLAGIVTERDFMKIADHLLEEFLRREADDVGASN
ncbi:MAG: CBS domain-containing protein, partial [Acidobacteriota bacterium]